MLFVSQFLICSAALSLCVAIGRTFVKLLQISAGAVTPLKAWLCLFSSRKGQKPGSHDQTEILNSLVWIKGIPRELHFYPSTYQADKIARCTDAGRNAGGNLFLKYLQSRISVNTKYQQAGNGTTN